MRRYQFGLGFGLVLLLGCGGGGGTDGGSVGPTPTSFSTRVIASGLSQPMQYISHPSRSDLAYVIERGGTVRVLVNDALQTSPVLDISSELTTDGEGGLLGITFDPQFASNRFFYLHYSTGATVDTQVSRFTMNADMLSASPASSHSVIRIGQAPHNNHKGGSINFGNDGYLYLATGDGGSGNDPDNRAQDPSSLLGKILRIDPKGGDLFPGDPIQNYAIPSGNPWATSTEVRREIWAFGLRNPFRWSIDRPTGALLLADVGQNAFEEVNYEPANRPRRNYGWRVREGNSASGNPGPTFSDTFTEPFVSLDHGQARSITGGFVYRGRALGSAMVGRYLIADFVFNRFWSVAVNLVAGEAASAPVEPHNIVGGLNGPVAIDPDANGEPIISELNSGRLTRLIPAP